MSIFMSSRARKALVLGAFLVLTSAVAASLAISSPAQGTGQWSTPTLIYDPVSVQTQAYSYAPSAIAGDPDRTYTCHSRGSGQIHDEVFLTKRTGGAVKSSVSVLSGSSGWDSFHNCDPNVVQVNTTMSGHTYTYAMFYRGNDADCACHNQIGVAYGDSLDGPWVKSATPAVAFASGAPISDWGVGEPSATTVNASAGTAVLTWTEKYSATGTVARMAQVNVSSGTPVLSAVHALSTAGLTDTNSTSDYLNNFDIAYSPQRDRFFAVRETHPYPSDTPNNESTAVQVVSIAGSDMWAGTGAWTVEGGFGAPLTGKARNHNPGLVRTAFGTLPDEAQVTVRFTEADAGSNSLWTDKIWETSATIAGSSGGSGGTAGSPGIFASASVQEVYAPSGSQEYAYAPSAVADGSNRYYYSCHNAVSGQINDHIFFSEVDSAGATPQQDFSVIQGSSGAWDSTHTCDPSIVAVKSVYGSVTYSLAMFYLGTSYPNSNNAIGVALSNSYGGPWVKYAAPLVTSPFTDTNLWGAGMPSATTVDYNAGKVLLFYSVDGNDSNSGTRAGYVDSKNVAYVRQLDLSNMASPVVGPAVAISTAGLINTTGAQDVLHNFDVAYDPPTDRFYMVREQHPFPTDDPWYISTSVEVSSIPGSDIWAGTGTWRHEGTLSQTQTGFARTHNPGLLRTIYGALPDPSSLTVVFTKSNAGSFPATLWGYQLWQTTVSR